MSLDCQNFDCSGQMPPYPAPSTVFNGINFLKLRGPKPHLVCERRTFSISAASECSYVQQECTFQDVTYEPDAHADPSAIRQQSMGKRCPAAPNSLHWPDCEGPEPCRN